MVNKLLNGIPVSLINRANSRRLGRRQFASTPKRVKFRPADGGLNTSISPSALKLGDTPFIRDAYFFKDELRKAYGASRIGQLLSEEAVWAGVWPREDAIRTAIAITIKNLYKLSGERWTRVAPGNSLSGTLNNPISTAVLDGKFCFVSFDYELRQWDGGERHSAVVGGFAARSMDAFNNRLVLCHTIESGVANGQTVRWTANGEVNFTAIGSGARDLSERSDQAIAIRKLGPYRGLVYKDNSIVDMRATGSFENPFDTTELIGGLGLLLPLSIAEWAGGHFFVGSDQNIYFFDGSSFQNIGEEIQAEFFTQINESKLDIAVGTYDAKTREYIICIPIGTDEENSVYYAYSMQKKRWRSGVYKGLVRFSTYQQHSGLSWDEDTPGSWDDATDSWNDEVRVANKERTICVVERKVLEFVESINEFEGTPLQFEYHTLDIAGEVDGDEVTLLEMIVGYTVDGSCTLTVDASNDGGNSFIDQKEIVLGTADSGYKVGDKANIHIPFLITGDNVRARIRNSDPAQQVRITSITLRASIAKSSRSENKV